MKRKGFTLIELLAVIVVLAVIALIATPTILGVIENSIKGAFKDSVYGIMDAAEFYMATNVGMENGTFICNGEKCFNQSNEKGKLNFKGEVPISGNVIIEKNKISVEQLSNGKYCANGTRENLVISTDCTNIDQSAPEINEESLSYTSTTNSATIIFSNFVSNEEDIEEYQITLNNETKTVSPSEVNVMFSNLKYNTEYEVIIKVIGKNKQEIEVKKTIKTKTINIPIIEIEKTPESATSGYVKTQVAKITYDSTNIESPRYFIKTTRVGSSNIEINKACGNGINPGECSEITGTKLLDANIWYEVSGNIEVTYSEESNITGTIYARIYDGINYTEDATGSIFKIDTTSPIISLSDSRSTKDTIEFVVSYSDNYSLAFETENCTYGVASSEENECRASGGSGGSIDGESEYYIDGLVSGKTYQFKICIQDDAGNKTCETFSLATLDPTPKFTLQNTLNNFGTNQQGKYYKQVVLIESMIALPTIDSCIINDNYDNEYDCDITSIETTPVTSGYEYALQVTFGNDSRDIDLDYQTYFYALLNVDINGSSYSYEYEYDA